MVMVYIQIVSNKSAEWKNWGPYENHSAENVLLKLGFGQSAGRPTWHTTKRKVNYVAKIVPLNDPSALTWENVKKSVTA